MPKKLPITIEVPTITPKRKRPAPKNAFKPGNQYAFKRGHSGNPAGRPKDESRNAALVSNALRGQLGVTAPYQIAETLGLAPGASWAQCLGASLIRRAVAGDIAAARLVLDATENTRATLGIATSPDGTAPPSLEVFLISPATGKPASVPIEGTPELPVK
jgi:hypothetical protein